VCNAGTCIRDNLAIRASAGIAVNWKSPFGPVEVDIGYPFLQQSYDKPQIIRLSAGTTF
jgi:outer membrane protein insertion porin family